MIRASATWPTAPSSVISPARSKRRRTRNQTSARTPAHAQINTLCESINFSKQVSTTAQQLYKKALHTKQFKHKSQDAIIASCIFIACQRNNTGRTFEEITALMHVPKNIDQTFKALEKFFQRLSQQRMMAVWVGTPAVQAESNTTLSTKVQELCYRYASQLSLTAKIGLISGECATAVVERGSLADRSPRIIAAVCIYMISHLMGDGKNRIEISRVADVSDDPSDDPIRSAYKLVYNERERLVKQDWLGQGGRFSRLPSIKPIDCPIDIFLLIFNYVPSKRSTLDQRLTCRKILQCYHKTISGIFKEIYTYKGALPIMMDRRDLEHVNKLSDAPAFRDDVVKEMYIVGWEWATKEELKKQLPYWLPLKPMEKQTRSIRAELASTQSTDLDRELLATIVEKLTCKRVTVGLHNFANKPNNFGGQHLPWSLRHRLKTFEYGTYALAKNNLQHFSRLLQRVLSSLTRYTLEVERVHIRSHHIQFKRPIIDDGSSILTFLNTHLQDNGSNLEVTLRIGNMATRPQNHLEPLLTNVDSQLQFWQYLFKSAIKLEFDIADTPLRSFIDFGAFENVSHLYLESLHYPGNLADNLQRITRPNVVELVNIQLDKKYLIHLFNTLAQAGFSSTLRVAQLKDECGEFLCLGNCSDSCPTDPEEGVDINGPSRLQEVAALIHDWHGVLRKKSPPLLYDPEWYDFDEVVDSDDSDTEMNSEE